MTLNLKIHHLGKIVDNIPKQYKFYQELGFKTVSGFDKKLLDKKQCVLVGAVKKGSVLIELLEPYGKNSPVASFLKTGQGFHHICYQTKILEATIEIFKKNLHCRQITPVAVSVWDKRPVVFFISSAMEIVELIGPKK